MIFLVLLHHLQWSISQCHRSKSCSTDGRMNKRTSRCDCLFYLVGDVFCIISSSHSNEYACTISVRIKPNKQCIFHFYHRQIISQVLGDLQFNFYHRWFDCIFLLSALFSIGIHYLQYRSSQQSISFYDKNVQKVKQLSPDQSIIDLFFYLGLFLMDRIETSVCVCVCAVNNECIC